MFTCLQNKNIRNTNLLTQNDKIVHRNFTKSYKVGPIHKSNKLQGKSCSK